MTGVMYKQFSVTIAVSVLISAFVALTLTPALCALIIKPNRQHQEPKGFFKWFDNFFEWVTEAYLSGVRFFLNHRKRQRSVSSPFWQRSPFVQDRAGRAGAG